MQLPEGQREDCMLNNDPFGVSTTLSHKDQHNWQSEKSGRNIYNYTKQNKLCSNVQGEPIQIFRRKRLQGAV